MGTLVKSIDNFTMSGIVLFLLGVSVGLMDYFVYHHSIVLNLIAAAALLMSIRILSQHSLPTLKLLVGASLTIALFSQAYFIESLLSAILGLVMFLASAAEYKKDMVKAG